MSDEQAVLVRFQFAGSEEEIEAFDRLSDRLEETISSGEFDGHEIGEGRITLFFYGPSADDLLTEASPALREALPFFRNAFAIKRYGGPEDEDAIEVRVEHQDW